jgi:crossover junction endodeoxyribonuclease RuvC
MTPNREVILAVDPGATGAVAMLVDGALVEVEDMPFLSLRVNKTVRKRVDPHTLDGLFKSLVKSHVGPMDDLICIVEQVGPMPKDGPVQAFNFGMAYAYVIMGFASNRWPMEKVTPPVWKAALKLRKDKSAARQRAMEMFPAFKGEFARVKDDGRAEAALLGYYLHVQRKRGNS